MWLSTLQYVWSFLFYCAVTLVCITAIGACKKLSQDKGKTYTHLSKAVAANAPQWRAALPDNTLPTLAIDEDNSGRRRRMDESSSYETEDEAEEERRERARERERERERQRVAEREKAEERERGREEKERERRRRGEESDETDRSVGVRRRRRGPLSAGGGEEAEDEQQLVMLKGSSGSSDEQILDGYSTSPDSPVSPHSPLPFSSSSGLSLASRSLHSSSAPRTSTLGPVILPSVDVLAYRELVRLVHSAWREGLLRSQRTLIGTLIEREKERGRLTDVAATVLSRVVAMYETRRRKAADKEGEGGEVDEADVVADVHSLLRAGERKEADDGSGESADIVNSIRAAAALVATSGEQQQDTQQTEGMKEEVEEQSTTGALNLTLQRLLSLPLPPPPAVPLQPPIDQLTFPSSESTVPSIDPLLPLPALPPFDPVVLANRYLSDSHTARTTVTQQLCTDRPEVIVTSQLPSQLLPLDRSSLPHSSSHFTHAPSSTTSDGLPVLRPVYAVPSLQTRYLNVELLSEMELVMYAVQQRMEQLVADKLKDWIRRDNPPPQPATQQPLHRPDTVQQQQAADKREVGDATVRVSSALPITFSSPQPSHRTSATPLSTSSSPSLSPGAPLPSIAAHTTPVLLPPTSTAAIKRSSSSESAALADKQPIVYSPVFPPASSPARSRALSVADRHVATVASPPPMSVKQPLRKQSATGTRTSTPATPHSTTSVSYYHTSPPFTPNHNHSVATVPIAVGRPPPAHSPFHSATSPSTVTVPVLPPRPPSSGGSPRTQRARAAGAYKRENGSPSTQYATADAIANGSGRGLNGYSSSSSGGGRGREERPSTKHLRSKSLVGYGAVSPYVASRDVSSIV